LQGDARLRLDVYVITSSGRSPGRDHLAVGLAAVRGGAGTVQLRAPELEDEELRRVATALAKGCTPRGVLFVVNDRADVAAECGAGGVHVGQTDDYARARERVGADRVLGVSVADREQARQAERAGADYLGVTVWPTPTKPEASSVGLEGLRSVVESTALPVVGIGGIDASNAGDVIAAGAAGVAVVSAVGAADDPVEATRALVRAVERARQARPE
jgi:thiamine-phosphate pyrophosphorylase